MEKYNNVNSRGRRKGSTNFPSTFSYRSDTLTMFSPLGWKGGTSPCACGGWLQTLFHKSNIFLLLSACVCLLSECIFYYCPLQHIKKRQLTPVVLHLIKILFDVSFFFNYVRKHILLADVLPGSIALMFDTSFRVRVPFLPVRALAEFFFALVHTLVISTICSLSTVPHTCSNCFILVIFIK